MRRLSRWTFNGVASISAVLFVATCLLWARSCRNNADQLTGRYLSGNYTISSKWSELRIDLKPDKPVRPAAQSTTGATINRALFPGLQWTEYRVRCSSGGNTWTDLESQTILFGYWLLSLGFILIPLAAITPAVTSRFRQREMLASRLCPTCGYDLRATPERCPECGAAAVKE